jgi:hypothetical protein
MKKQEVNPEHWNDQMMYEVKTELQWARKNILNWVVLDIS